MAGDLDTIVSEVHAYFTKYGNVYSVLDKGDVLVHVGTYDAIYGIQSATHFWLCRLGSICESRYKFWGMFCLALLEFI